MVEYVRQEALPVEKFGHQPRLYALARLVGVGEVYDDDALFAAAWLHDIGVFLGHRPEEPEALARWDNVAYAVEKVPAILARLGFPASKVAAVVEAIRTHLPSAEPTSVEGTILRDADILEQLGAIGILRAVCKVGRDTRYPTFTTAVNGLRKAAVTLPPQLRSESAQAMAQSKIDILEAFLLAVEEESQGALL